MRLPVPLALALCLALPPSVEASQAPEATRPLIDKSVIAFPRKLGDYTLEEAKFDPAAISDGVFLHYAIADTPVRLDIYVYPLGRVPAEQALAGGMASIEEAIRAHADRGLYRDVRFGEVSRFTVPWSDAPGTAAPPVAATTTRDPEVAAMMAALDAFPPPTELVGQRRGLQMLRGEVALQSLAYLFYRQLYLIKVRASADLAAGSQAAFEEVVDRAVTALVPAIRIANTGGCQQSVLVVSRDFKGPEDLWLAMGRAKADKEREGCHSVERAVPDGHATQAIEFPADAWKGQ